MLSQLPNFVLLEVLQKLDGPSLATLGATCKQVRGIVQSSDHDVLLWKDIARSVLDLSAANYGEGAEQPLPPSKRNDSDEPLQGTDWRELYFRLRSLEPIWQSGQWRRLVFEEKTSSSLALERRALSRARVLCSDSRQLALFDARGSLMREASVSAAPHIVYILSQCTGLKSIFIQELPDNIDWKLELPSCQLGQEDKQKESRHIHPDWWASSMQQQMPAGVTTLGLAGSRGITALPELLPPLLVRLDLCGCALLKDAAVAQGLRQLAHLQWLALAHTGAGPLTLSALTQQGFKGQLRYLDLSHCNRIDGDDDALGRLLASGCSGLRELRLRGTHVGATWRRLVGPRLLSLDLRGCGCSGVDAASIQALRRRCPQLKRLNLRENVPRGGALEPAGRDDAPRGGALEPAGCDDAPGGDGNAATAGAGTTDAHSDHGDTPGAGADAPTAGAGTSDVHPDLGDTPGVDGDSRSGQTASGVSATDETNANNGGTRASSGGEARAAPSVAVDTDGSSVQAPAEAGMAADTATRRGSEPSPDTPDPIASAADSGTGLEPLQEGCAPSAGDIEVLKLGWMPMWHRSRAAFLLAGTLLGPSLRVLTAGLGVTLGDEGLRQVAAACPRLHTLRLHHQPVTDTGVCAVLEGCAVAALSLCGCTGPFTDALCRTLAARCPGLRTLKLVGGAPCVTGPALSHALLATPGGQVQRLALVGLARVHGRHLVAVLQHHARRLVRLKLERCGQRALGESTDAGASGESADVLAWMVRSSLPALTSVHVRHCEPRGDPCSGAEPQSLHPRQWLAACPRLQALSLDLCDIPPEDQPVFQSLLDPNSPSCRSQGGLLRYVVVARCRQLRGLLNVKVPEDGEQGVRMGRFVHDDSLAADLQMRTVVTGSDCPGDPTAGARGVCCLSSQERLHLFPLAYTGKY